MNPPDNNYEQQLEQWASRRLKSLPDAPAPRALFPNVMAALQARQALPWYQRAWMTWPLPAQVFSILVLLGMGVGISQGAGVVTQTVNWTGWPAWIANLTGEFQPAWTLLDTLTLAATVLLRNLNPLVLLSVIGTCFAMYFSCVGMGTVFYRLVLKPTRN